MSGLPTDTYTNASLNIMTLPSENIFSGRILSFLRSLKMYQQVRLFHLRNDIYSEHQCAQNFLPDI